MAKNISLNNGRFWKSQKDAESHFRTIRDRYPLNTPIDDSADHKDLVALLERYDSAHPEQESKIGCGIDYFEVRTNYASGGVTKGFWVVRNDNSATDFSFIWAVKGMPKPQAQEFNDACRAIVNPDIKAAKRRFFASYKDADGRVPCEVSGRLITSDEAHVDHAYPTFGALVISFRAANGWHHEIPNGLLSRPTDNQLTTAFANERTAETFRRFHHAAASLRVVAKEINLAAAAEQRKPKIQRPVQL